MVGEGGVEPPRPYGHTDLNRARLPFRHSPEGTLTLADSFASLDPDTIGRECRKERFVGVLQAFERRLGGLVEGAFAKVFKGDVQPVEIAGALQREADDRRAVVGQGRILVPNDYIVELGDHDYHRLEEWAEPLGDELAAMVREHAAESGYSFVGPVKVNFEQHPEVGTGVFRIRSASSAAGTAEPVLTTPTAPTAPAAPGPPRPAPAGALPQRPRLIVAVGHDESAYFLSHPVTVIGRAVEADIRIDDPGVSRRHAELRYADGEVELVDLGSTNGVVVNGIPTSRATLRDSDRIDVASTTLIFRRDED
jgi:hypothetical protein